MKAGKLHVAVTGEGRDVLLIHGFPDDHTVWRNQIDALVAGGYRIIAPDTRGRGQSPSPADVGAYRLRWLVDDMIDVLDDAGASKVRVVGHDWGAVIGWALCMRHPERVERYVAVSVGHPNAFAAAPIEQKLRSSYALAFQLRGVSEWILRWNDWFALRAFSGCRTESDRWAKILSAPGRLTAALNYYRANLRLALKTTYPDVDVPVMGIWSTKDRFLIEQQMRNSSRYVGGPWRYERIEGANHWVQLDRPHRLNALLLDFFA